MSNQAHVLVACHAWYGDMIGGAFRLASEFAEYLAERGHKVSYLCCAADTSTNTPPEKLSEDLTIYRYSPPNPASNGLLKLRYHVSATARLARQIHSRQQVHAASSHSPLQGLGVAREMSKSGVYVNYTVHSPFDDELLSNIGDDPSLMQRLAVRMARRVDRRNVALADRIQTDSEYTLQNFRSKYDRVLQDKGVVAPGWVETDLFQPANNRRRLREQLGGAWLTDLPLLFTLRRLENRMGLDTFVDACKIVLNGGLQFRTLLGGGGSLRETLQQRINEAGLAENIFLLGRLPEEDLAPAYAAADCFVLPTKALECFGLIVLESYACNTPVIASNVAAIPELAKRQGDEWMFEPGNVQQLADRIRAFVTGDLKPTIDLRAVALEYEKSTVLREWEALLALRQQPLVNA